MINRWGVFCRRRSFAASKIQRGYLRYANSSAEKLRCPWLIIFPDFSGLGCRNLTQDHDSAILRIDKFCSSFGCKHEKQKRLQLDARQFQGGDLWYRSPWLLSGFNQVFPPQSTSYMLESLT